MDSEKSTTPVLLRVQRTIFIQFNCAKGYNIHAEVPNTITLTHANSERSRSDRLVALAEGKSFSYNFEEIGEWTFQACKVGSSDDEISFASLSIHKSHTKSACLDPVIPVADPWSVSLNEALRSGDGFLMFLSSLILLSFALLTLVSIQTCCDGMVLLARRRTAKGKLSFAASVEDATSSKRSLSTVDVNFS